MFKLSYEQILQKVTETGKISEADFKQKIEEKLASLKGLVSQEGAAHIIANEMGIKLFDASSGKLELKNIVPGMRNVDVVGVVSRIFPAKAFKTEKREGKVGSFIIADETGTSRVVAWGDKTDILEKLSEGVTVKVTKAYSRQNNRDQVEIHLNDTSEVIINPEGVEIKPISNDIKRKLINELQRDDRFVEIVATVVQIFEPRFFETCTQCRRRIRQRGEGTFVCDQHGTVEPQYSYLLNAILDDGSSNIRTVFFREQAEELAKKSSSEFLALRENTEEMEKLKYDLLGKMVKVQGDVKHNELFDRSEFVAKKVYTDLNPEDEIKKLDEEINKLKTEEPRTDASPAAAPQATSQPAPQPAQQPTPQATPQSTPQSTSREETSADFEEEKIKPKEEKVGFSNADEIDKPKDEPKNEPNKDSSKNSGEETIEEVLHEE